MTSQQPQIQALIHEIDEVLRKTSPRLPWVMSSDALQQRQILEQTRKYLASLEQTEATDRAAQSSMTPYPIAPGAPQMASAAYSAESAQQVLQAVLQEMNYLRLNLLQPLRSDVEMLQRQREMLLQEVRQLEGQRQQYALAPQPLNSPHLTEFLQSAMGQMQETLKGQMAQMLATLATPPHAAQTPPLLNAEEALSPAQRLEHLQLVQSQSDRLLMKLDSTLRVIFDSLQSNIQSYQDSLEQGLNRMYNLGQQGEAVFSTMVNRLADQLGREASAYLKTALQEELAAAPESARRPRRLVELDAPDDAPDDSAVQPSSDERWQPPDPLPPATDPANLDALKLELNQLDLAALPPEQLEFDSGSALFQADTTFPFADTAPDREAPPQAAPPTDELGSALDLFDQIVEDPDSESLLDTTPSAVSAPKIELVETPDRLYDDEYYDLFKPEVSSSAEADVNALPFLAEQDLFGELSAPVDAPTNDTPANNPPDNNTPDNNPPDNELTLEAFAEDELPVNEVPLSVESLLLSELESTAIDSFASDSSSAVPASQATDRPSAFTTGSFELADLFAEAPQLDVQPETDLFAEVASSDAQPETDLFAEVAPPDAQPTVEPMETIATLADLLPDAPAQPAAHPSIDGESYESAQPHEDLLAAEPSFLETVPDFQLPNDTLQQLSADLLQLEESSPSAPELDLFAESWTAPPSPAAPVQDAESLLFSDELLPAEQPPAESALEDLFSEVGPEPIASSEAAKSEAQARSPQAADRPNNSAFTLNGLESLFEGVASSDNSAALSDGAASEEAAKKKNKFRDGSGRGFGSGFGK